MSRSVVFFFFFFNDTATTEIYTLSLHDALPISWRPGFYPAGLKPAEFLRYYAERLASVELNTTDRKSTRLNSSHSQISYAVFCLKKKNDREIAMWRRGQCPGSSIPRTGLRRADP